MYKKNYQHPTNHPTNHSKNFLIPFKEFIIKSFTKVNSEGVLKKITLLLFCSLLLLKTVDAQTPVSQCNCTVNTLPINTGVNYALTGTPFYGVNANDEYWTLTTAPSHNINYNVPKCAKVWENTSTIFSTNLPTAGVISADNNWVNCDGNMRDCWPYAACQLSSKPNNNFYTFSRSFKVCLPPGATTQISIPLEHYRNDTEFEIWLIGPGVNLKFPTTNSFCNIGGPFTTTLNNVTCSNGIYTIHYQLLNYKISCNGTNNLSDMWLKIKGSILSSINCIVDNKNFGKGAVLNNNCSAQMPEPIEKFAVIGSPCQSTFTISPYQPSATYTITPSAGTTIFTTGSQVGKITVPPIAAIYTVTSTNGNCSASTVFKVSKPSFNFTPSNSICANTAPVNVTTSVVNAGAGNITYSMQTIGGILNTLNPSLATQTKPYAFGLYTITATDILGCTVTTTLSVGKNFNANLSTNLDDPSNCVAWGSTFTQLTAQPNILTNSNMLYSYAWSANCIPTTPTYKANIGVVTNATNYSVTVTSQPFGCTSTASVQLKPYFYFDVASTVPCLSTISAGSATLTCTSPISPLSVHYTALPTLAIPLTVAPNNQFSIPGPGVYTITPNLPSGSNFCNAIPKTIFVKKCVDCEIPPYPNRIVITGGNTSALFPLGAAPNVPLFITGPLVVDANFSLFNNSQIFIGAQGSITVINGAKFTMLNCEMRSCGDYMWDGINLPLTNTALEIRNCKIYDMEFGIRIKSSDIIIAGTEFINSGNQSLYISDMDASTVKIYGNRFLFNHIAGIAMKLRNATAANIPAGFTDCPENGIVFENVTGIKLGFDYAGYSSGNTFDNIQNGVDIRFTNAYTNSAPYNINYDLSYNIFKNITDKWVAGAFINYQKINNYLTAKRGTAIRANFSNKPNYAINLKMLGNTNILFDNCDKGIMVNNAYCKFTNLKMNNVLLAIMGLSLNCGSDITGCNLNNVHRGIYASINYNKVGTTITGNIVSTNNTGVQRSNFLTIYPVGVEITEPIINASPNKSLRFNKNTINLNSPKGVCVSMHDMNFTNSVIAYPSSSLLAGNMCYLSNLNSTTAAAGGPVIGELGFYIKNCPSIYLSNNYVKGNFDNNNATIHPSAGWYIEDCPNIGLSCNNISHTFYGNYISGSNIGLNVKRISYNHFNANKIPWFCGDYGGSAGTFGDVGSLGGFDAANNFLFGGINPTIDWRATSAGSPISTYRNSGFTPPIDNIFTDISFGTIINAAPPLTKYPFTLNTVAFNDPCNIVANKVIFDSTANIIDNNTRLDEEDDIALDSNNYITNAACINWINDQNLYMALDDDAVHRNSDARLSAFYAATQSQPIGQLYSVVKQAQTLLDNNLSKPQLIDIVNTLNYNNSTIATSTVWETNAQQIQQIYLNYLANGVDALQATEVSFAEALANQCPFVAGSSVYLARNVLAVIDPSATYDDRYLCSVYSQNKKQNPWQTYDEYLLQNDSILYNATQAADFTIKLYPNPANNSITINYTCAKSDGVFTIYSINGEALQQIILDKYNTKQTIDLTKFTAGLYTYKCIFAACGTTAGKFIKID